jgi:cytochrome c peroxidase
MGRSTTVAATLLLLTGAARAACPGYSVCPAVDYPAEMARNPQVKTALALIDTQEAATLAALQGNGLSFAQLVSLLGEALVLDKSLSVRGNEACAFCHGQAAGFAGGLPPFVPAGGVFPGSLTGRAGLRAPQSMAYAAFAPVLSWQAAAQQFVGGNFWDSRATGLITGSPSADQAAVPLTNPFEMALPDPACAVRRVALAPYGAVFGKVWGANALAISWPADTDALCAHANNGGANQTPLALSPSDRARATLTVEQIGLTIGAFEDSTAVSPFSSKFDAVQAGQARFSAQERAGYALFTGQGQCSACHSVSGDRPLFTGFTSANIGIPHNAAVPYLSENAADRLGYVANPAGPAFVDEGLGGFLASAADTNPQWQALAGQFLGAFQVPTLRNVAARPRRRFPRSYMHNGYFTDLRTVVHFLNTRDVLPRCTGSGGVGVTCWPAPEVAANLNTAQTGNLGLSKVQEGAVVAFLETLTDEYVPRGLPR